MTRTRDAAVATDAPIGKAEKVATSVSEMMEVGDAVIDKSDAAGDLLDRAVDLANDGNLGAARRLYSGDAATSVQQVSDELAKARATQTTAQQAVAELTALTP